MVYGWPSLFGTVLKGSEELSAGVWTVSLVHAVLGQAFFLERVSLRAPTNLDEPPLKVHPWLTFTHSHLKDHQIVFDAISNSA